MRRPAVLLGSALFVIAFASSQAQQTNQAYLNKIVNARFIMVTTESGDPFDPKVMSDDRRAAGDIQNKIKEWKRFTLVYRKEDADIVIAVRSAGRVRANAGIHIDTGRQNKRPLPPGAHDPSQPTTTSIGPILTADARPKDDLFSVYDAADYPSSAVLWRKEQKNGLSYPTIPLFEQFKKDIEKTAAKKKP
jgi:hypothetical protein